MIKSTSKSKLQTTIHKPHTIPTLRALLLALCLLTFTSTTTATIRYVSPTGNNIPPYLTWEDAANSIQDAINVCVNGDTIYVANGIYKENLVINTEISLIGSSMDSTVINGLGLGDYTVVFNAIGIIENFNIYGKGEGSMGTRGIRSLANIEIRNCQVSKTGLAIGFLGNSLTVFNVIAKNLTSRGISIFPTSEGNNYVSNCIVLLTNPLSVAIEIGFGGTHHINNNILIFNNDISLSDPGISLGWPRRVYITNNLISGFKENITFDIIQDSAFIKNNLAIYKQKQNNTFSIFTTGTRVVAINNVLANNPNTAFRGLSSVGLDYNLFWNNENDLSGLTYGDSDRVADPMFVSDTVPTPNSNYDFHLQAFSPGIDKGDPNILDVDGSRSDIGMYGGPLGQAYKYLDLAPKAPRNLSAVVDTNFILVKWNRNTEADTSHYRVYRDTVTNFTIDSTKLIASPTDTFFIQLPPYEKDQYVYKITCVDNQGNESLPSEELVINITSMTTNDYPMTINDYLLYQNYPNPFNPTTTIGYKLKERGYVKLMVYDIKGELISVLINKDQEPGYYEVEFNVGNGLPSVPDNRNLASGIYLYRIEVIGEGRIPVYSDMKKMILLK